MTAAEARALMAGSMKYKGFWFKTRLTWFCGRINEKIEKAAEYGEDHVIYEVEREATARKYFPLLAQYYEELGYYIAYSYNQCQFEIYWDLSKLSSYIISQLKYNYHYDHHIKLEEPKNESNCTSNRDGEDQRTTIRSTSEKRGSANPKQKSASRKSKSIRDSRD